MAGRSAATTLVGAVVGAAVFGTITSIGSSTALANQERAEWCHADERGRFNAERMPARFSRSECDISGAVVFRGIDDVPTPPVGQSYAAESFGYNRPSSTLVVTATGDGFEIADDLEIGSAPSSSSPGPCSDNTVGAGTNYKVRSVTNYYIRSGTIPSNVGASNGITAIRNGLASLVTHANDCSESRDPNAPVLSYGGTTSTAANYNSDGTCASLDTNAIVEFGALPAGVAGRTCISVDTSTGSLSRWDMRLKSGISWDYTLTDGCHNGNALDITSVVVHEFGHVYGLSHVSESTSPNLTMSTKINGPCQTSERTLGLGDMTHMFNKYGYL